MEDACGPIGGGGAGHALCGFKEGSEGGYGESIALGQGGEDAAKLISDDGGSELEAFGAGFETGNAAASTVGGGGGGGHGESPWCEMRIGYRGRWTGGGTQGFIEDESAILEVDL